MKTKIILILFFFCLITNYLKGQNYEYVNQDGPMSFAQTIAPIGDGTTLIGIQSGEYINWGQFQSKLIKIDSLGNHLWTFSDFPQQYGEFRTINDIKVIDTETIYVLTSYQGCDYGGQGCLHKMTTNGELIWSAPYIYGTIFSSIEIVETTNNIIVASEYDYHIISPDGELIQEGELSIDPKDALTLSSTHFIVAGARGFQYIDLSSQQNAIYETEKNFNNIVISSLNDIYLLHDKGILKIDESFQNIDSINFEISEYYEGMDIINDTIFLFGIKDNMALLKILDTNLNLITTHSIGGSQLYPTDLKINNNHLFMTAHQIDGINNPYYPSAPSLLSAYKGSGTLWAKSTPINNITNLPRPDIGISDITANFISFDSTTCLYYPNTISNCAFQDIQITVKNYGTLPIEHLNLNSRFEHCSYICRSYSSYLNTYSDINLAPNEEITLDIDILEVGSLQLNDDNSYDLCLWTSMPNNKMDDDLSNNLFCLIFEDIPVLVGINDLPSQNNITIYPNPTKDIITLETDIAKGQLQVFDVSGSLILEKEINSNKQAIDMSTLMTGIYIVKIIGQERQYVEKLVKE